MIVCQAMPAALALRSPIKTKALAAPVTASVYSGLELTLLRYQSPPDPLGLAQKRRGANEVGISTNIGLGTLLLGCLSSNQA